MNGRGRAIWIAGALLLALALPVFGQGVDGPNSGARLESGNAALPAAGARFETVSRRGRHHAKARAKAAPAVSRAQMELAHEMVGDSYALGKRLELRQRVALLTRLLYTMRPEVMAEEKRQWAEELFGLAQELPGNETAAESGNAALPAAGAQAIATAAVRVAVYDSDRALELLDTLPSQGGRREDARTMASRLVFAMYLQHHGAAGTQTLLAHARKWGEHGGFPYAASAAALVRLGGDEDASEGYFRQELAVFARGQEGLYGVKEFAGLLDRAVTLEAISDASAEEAGQDVVAQLGRLTETSGSAAGGKDAAAGDGTGEPVAALRSAGEGSSNAALPAAGAFVTDEEQRQVTEALDDVRLSAPKAYAKAVQDWPGLFAMGRERVASDNAALPAAGASAGNALRPAPGAGVDAGLQASFAELAEVLRERGGPEVLREAIAKGLQRVNARYRAGECGECLKPDAQSWALVSLAAYASPMTIAGQLKTIEEPFWRAYFMAIAAQQVGEPTRVADPTAHIVVGKEEAEPEE